MSAYGEEFSEDFSGANGRSKKVLWLTEVAGGTADVKKQTQFATDLMSKNGVGLAMVVVVVVVMVVMVI